MSKDSRIKLYLKQSKVILFFRILHEKWLETILFARFISNGNRYKIAKHLLTDLTIRVHAIEKGMSIGGVRPGFGKPKVKALIKDLDIYLSIGGEQMFVNEACSVIKKYIEFNEALGVDMSDIKEIFTSFCKKRSVQLKDMGGVLYLSKEKMDDERQKPFAAFSQSRYTVRDFSDKVISKADIQKALKLCERTPSACNRQSWRIYVYTDSVKRKKLFEMQKGCNGFIENMQAAILVCGDIQCYNFHELHQLYVDGGIYAMNLMYSLHYYNLANIPLTMGLKYSCIQDIKRELDIPDNELPVILIGVGSYKERFRVAESHRFDYQSYTRFV